MIFFLMFIISKLLKCILFVGLSDNNCRQATYTRWYQSLSVNFHVYTYCLNSEQNEVFLSFTIIFFFSYLNIFLLHKLPLINYNLSTRNFGPISSISSYIHFSGSKFYLIYTFKLTFFIILVVIELNYLALF